MATPESDNLTAAPTEREDRATETPDTSAPDELVESDLLVEDVSIDGMCGVY